MKRQCPSVKGTVALRFNAYESSAVSGAITNSPNSQRPVSLIGSALFAPGSNVAYGCFSPVSTETEDVILMSKTSCAGDYEYWLSLARRCFMERKYCGQSSFKRKRWLKIMEARGQAVHAREDAPQTTLTLNQFGTPLAICPMKIREYK